MMKKKYIAPETIDVQLIEGDDLTQSLLVQSGEGKQVSNEEDIFTKEEWNPSEGEDLWETEF